MAYSERSGHILGRDYFLVVGTGIPRESLLVAALATHGEPSRPGLVGSLQLDAGLENAVA